MDDAMIYLAMAIPSLGYAITLIFFPHRTKQTILFGAIATAFIFFALSKSK